MVIKKKPAKSSGNDVIAKLKKKQSVLNRSRTKSAPAGFMKDEEVIEALGLKVGKGQTAKAQLRSVKLEEVNGTPIFKFAFTIQEDPGKGTPVQESVWLPLDDDDALEKSMDSIVFILQKLGYETGDLTIDMLGQLAEELTEEKPYCIIYLSCYKVKSGPNKGKVKYGLRVNSPYDPEDSKEEPEKEEAEEETEEEEEYEDEDETEEEDSEDSEEADEDEESEEDSEEFDEDDPSTWVGYTCKSKPKGTKTEAEYELTAYTKRNDTFTAKNKAGKTFKITSDEVIDWV